MRIRNYFMLQLLVFNVLHRLALSICTPNDWLANQIYQTVGVGSITTVSCAVMKPVINVTLSMAVSQYKSCISSLLLPSIRQHLSYGDCLEDEREDCQNCSVLYCVT